MDGKDSSFSSRILSLEAPFGRPAKSPIVPSADSSQSTEVQTFPFSAVLRISPIDGQFTMLELVSPTLQNYTVLKHPTLQKNIHAAHKTQALHLKDIPYYTLYANHRRLAQYVKLDDR